MTYSVSVLYLPCQTCHAKVHCDECEHRLEEALMRIRGIHGASVQMATKQVCIDGSVDMDTLEEMIEEVGLLIV